MEGIPSQEPLQGTDWLNHLPEDVLWTILGLLDLPTLYTARLICKRIRKSAAEYFKALDCTTLEELPTTDFTQFCSTTHLAVTATRERHLQSLVDPRIAPIVTHVSLKGFHLWDSQTAGKLEAVLMRLPRLQSVSLQALGGNIARLPVFPTMLEELAITPRPYWNDSQQAGVGDASPLTCCSQLTSLAIELVPGAETSLGSLSSLRNLRSLDLCSCSSALGLLSTFPALTSLTFEERGSGGDGSLFQDLGRLTGLSRLALTRIVTAYGVLRQAHLTCIAQLTNLTCLELCGCWFANSLEWSTALVPLSRLLSMQLCTMPCRAAASRLDFSRLHSLTLRNVSDAWILQRATRLTHLDLHCRTSLPDLGPAVAGMSGLRSLAISFYEINGGGPVFQLDGVLRACTILTKLAYQFGELNQDSDLEACASLPGLRSLSFEQISALTPAWLPALQAMSGLVELSLLDTGICVADMTPAVIAAFDAERRQLGWPLLKLRVEENGRRFERLER